MRLGELIWQRLNPTPPPPPLVFCRLSWTDGRTVRFQLLQNRRRRATKQLQAQLLVAHGRLRSAERGRCGGRPARLAAVHLVSTVVWRKACGR